MIGSARQVFIAGLLLGLAACDSGKPPADAVPKPAAIAPLPLSAPATTPAPVQPAEPSAKQKADAALAGLVKAALRAEPELQGFAIDVTADDGAVSLYGTAQTKARRDRAGQIAAKVAGVKSVSNNLAIVAGS